LLQTTISPKNRREHLTTPTTKGLRMTEEAIKVLNSCNADMFASLGEKKQQQLLEALYQMHQDACQPGKVGACSHPFNT
jgi:DNA-binding MarR family transcriptional regulator